MTNQEIAQEINNRIGNSPVPFDSVYSIALNIYQELGGEESQFDSVYSILLETLNVIDSGISAKVIDDSSISLTKTWSSSKIASELADAGFNVEIVTELPSVGDPHTIYFILKQDSSVGDVYDEWMYIDGNWEMVGNTQIDLSDYATIANVDASLALKADKTYVDASLATKANVYEIVTSAEIEDLFLYAQPNEIYYTSYQNRVVSPSNTEGLPAIVSNTNVNGKGKIEFASQITSLPGFMFESTGIQTIMLPDSITTLGDGAFASCSLKSFVCPENVTVISMGIFQDSTGLEYVELHSGITRIDNFAFSVSQYGHLTSITYKGTMAQWNAITKDTYWKQGASILTVVHCSDGDVNL